MAVYHLSMKSVSRGVGQSVVASAAYRAAECLHDQRTGETFDYTRKRAVEHSGIIAPTDAPDWVWDRAELWNRMEGAEKRRDAITAREVEVALPRELDPDERRELVVAFVRETITSRGLVADVAIHNPKARDGAGQPHAHILITERTVSMETGIGARKCRDFAGEIQTDPETGKTFRTTAGLDELRAVWAERQNLVLERSGSKERVDHRSLKAQRAEALERGDLDRAAELDREPEPKIGSAAWAMQKRGIVGERVQRWRDTVTRNAERAREWLADTAMRAATVDQLRGLGERLRKEREAAERQAAEKQLRELGQRFRGERQAKEEQIHREQEAQKQRVKAPRSRDQGHGLG